MALQPALQNNFIGGLKTEFTGLNFPENACTDTQNCVFSIIGDVTTREGINFENNFQYKAIATPGQAINQYLWRNAGGDGQTTVLVVQTGNVLNFYQVSSATETNPLSQQLLLSTINFTSFTAANNLNPIAQFECQFSDGNGYLFVVHPDCDPFYCIYNAGLITANLITLQVRDFNGITPEPGNSPVTFRPTTLTNEHNYNLQNQGWAGSPIWSAVAVQNSIAVLSGTTTLGLTPGAAGFNVATGLVGIIPGQVVTIYWSGLIRLFLNGAHGIYGASGVASGTVVSYSGSSLLLSATGNPQPYQIPSGAGYEGADGNQNWAVQPGAVQNTINTFKNGNGAITGIGFYPSNADIWYEYKDASGVFNPGATVGNVSIGFGQAPQGHYVFNPFIQQRSALSNIAGLTDIITTKRPRTSIFWQGRVWYAGVDDSQQATGDAAYYTWTENIYFSQIVSVPSDFGSCFQVNDPTDETLNQLLPSDGGVITIQGTGAIYKLFNMQNSLLIFAANGIWLVTGNQGIGFTATAYSINKISSVQSISGTSVIDINGVPIFWNEEDIYLVSANSDASPYNLAGFKVEPLTVGDILSFYRNIPKDSKLYVKGTYDPISYVIQWTYRTIQESGIANRYQMDGVLALNVRNRAFYPYTISSNNACYIAGPQYIFYPNSAGSPDPIIKYLTIVNGTNVTFSEENDDVNWLDWVSYDNVGAPYNAYFITGFRLEGKAVQKFSPTYLNMFLRNEFQPNGYKLQGIWDYASSGQGGKYTSIQQITNLDYNSNMIYRRHKLRGHGMSLQFKVSNIPGMPFDIMGWSEWSNKDTAF